MGSNAFPRLQRKTSHMVLLDITVSDVTSDVSGGATVSYQRPTLPGASLYNLCVLYLDNILEKQKYGFFSILIYND